MSEKATEENVLDKAFKDYSREEVPADKQHSWLSISLVWSGVGISLGLLLTGGTIGAGMTLGQASIAGFVGGIILAVIAALTGIIGSRLRLSTAMISKFAFGKKALLLIAFIQAVGSYGWFAVQLGLFGDTAATAWELLTGGSLNVSVVIVVGGLLMMSTALVGYRALDLLSKLSVPLMLVLIIASLFVILRENSWSEIISSRGTGDPVSLGLGISLTVSSFVVGAVIAPDVSRYSRSSVDTVVGAFVAFAGVTPIVLIIGSLLAMQVGTPDIVQIMIGLGWGVLALVLLMLAQWSSNDNNLYSAALALSAVFTRLQKWHVTLIAGLIGIVLALAGLYDSFTGFLTVLGVFIPPMAGVIIVDYFLGGGRDRYRSELQPSLPQIRIGAMSAWVAGSAVALVTTYTPVVLTSISSVDGLLAAAVVMYFCNRFSRRSLTVSPVLGSDTGISKAPSAVAQESA